MDFDGEVSNEGIGAGVWILDTNSGISKTYSYKINFQCTNSVAKYEALILWYLGNNLTLRAYKNVVLDVFAVFSKVSILFDSWK